MNTPANSAAAVAASPALYTAAQLAAALGRQPQSIRRALGDVEADGEILAHGKPAAAWAFASLPQDLRQAIADQAQRAGCRSPEDLLAHSTAPWRPPVSLDRIHADSWRQAEKLRRAMLPFLQGENDGETAGQFTKPAQQAYQAEFGHPVTATHWRSLFQRTIRRDRGFENWERREIYLPDRLRLIHQASAFNRFTDSDFATVQALIDAFVTPMEPTPAERENLWCVCFETLDDLAEAGGDLKRFKRSMLDYLARCAPFMVQGGRDSLKRQFNRLQELWKEKRPAAFGDSRPAANRGRSEPLPPADVDTIIRKAIFECEGRVAQAYREAKSEGGLTQETTSRFLANPKSASHVPAAVQRQVRPQVDVLKPWHIGERSAKLNGPCIERDWTGVHSGDWFQQDDKTPDVYHYVPDGQGWFLMLRGQFLPVVDVRSKRVLVPYLVSSPTFSALDLKRSHNLACREFRLPRKGFWFENGIFRSSLVQGKSVSLPGLGEYESGLRKLGLRIRYSLPGNARAKIVENIIGLLQLRMAGEPGYVGRDEMHVKYEAVHRALADVRERRIHPAEVKLPSRFGERGFYSADEWLARVWNICGEYNATPQNSKLTQGLSPDDAWEQFDDRDDPRPEIDARWALLVCCDSRPVRIGKNGIRLPFGGGLRYASAETARLYVEGPRDVLAHFDADFVDGLLITDMNEQNPRIIPRAPIVAADAESEDDLATFREALRVREMPNALARSRYAVLKSHYSPPARTVMVDAQTRALGIQSAQLRESVEQDRIKQQREKRRQENAARRVSERTGFAASILGSDDEGAAWTRLFEDEPEATQTEADV